MGTGFGNAAWIPVPSGPLVNMRVHGEMIQKPVSRRSACYLGFEDTLNTAARFNANDFLILYGDQIKEVEALFRIDDHTISLGTDGQVTVPDGLYYNISGSYPSS
jgi:hypothetical protein